MEGMLYVVGTPIGNLNDFTFRGIETLEMVDFIACEDTRHSIKLLNHFDISKKLISYHEYNKEEQGDNLLKLIKDGKNIALVTDAGMPCISDPGYDLVKLMYENSIKVTTVPTGTAVVSALVLSGLDSRRYIFEGFLPTNNKDRKEVLEDIGREKRTVVLYESPHHIKETLRELDKVLNNRQVAVVREMTKIYEEVLKGTPLELLEHFCEVKPKGEMVVVVEGRSKAEILKEKQDKYTDISIEDHYQKYIDEGVHFKEAIKLVAKDRALNKRDVYSIINK
ncbi:MAG: 16S rRNA (cytidine(1402)-2'-O)-methyltransferase [Lachnospirales bacterium]